MPYYSDDVHVQSVCYNKVYQEFCKMVLNEQDNKMPLQLDSLAWPVYYTVQKKKTLGSGMVQDTTLRED